MPEGGSDPASLAAEGWKQAKEFVGFFVDADTPGITTPTMIFACKPTLDGRRPFTVSLESALGLDPHGDSRTFSQTPENLLHGGVDKPIKNEDD